MPKPPVVNAGELIAALQRAGFAVRRQTGSHVTLRHPDGRIAVVPRHPGDLGTGLLVSILRRAGMTTEELRALL